MILQIILHFERRKIQYSYDDQNIKSFQYNLRENDQPKRQLHKREITITTTINNYKHMRKLLLFLTLCLSSLGAWAAVPSWATDVPASITLDESADGSTLTITSTDASAFDSFKNANFDNLNSYSKLVYSGNFSGFSILQGDYTNVKVIDVCDALLSSSGGSKGLTNSNIKGVVYKDKNDPEWNYQKVTAIEPRTDLLQEWVLIDATTGVAETTLNGNIEPLPTVLDLYDGNLKKVKIVGTLNDKSTLSQVDAPAIDLSDFTDYTDPFTFSNSYVKQVILPDYWDKAAVKAAAQVIAEGNTNFEAILSQHGVKNQSTKTAGVVAWVQKSGTLNEAMQLIWTDRKLGDNNCSMLNWASIMGYASARDFTDSNSSSTKFDENGHFVFNEPADETSLTSDMGISGSTRYLVGEYMDGGLQGAGNLLSIDLGDAIIYEEWNADITMGWTNLLDSDTRQVIFPQNSELKTIPADCLSGGGLGSLMEICIPGQIENIKTRAFYSASQCLSHVWTTGSDPDTRYDNGAFLWDGTQVTDTHYGQASLDDEHWGDNNEQTPKKFGTITLPPSLKLIESHAFSCEEISDVYVLTTTAPECHVDAFSTVMYFGNNTINAHIVDGMITRESYCVNYKNGQFITMLHYPRETTTPDIQRYTDPTREYMVATTLRDDKGNVIYFPNQAELNRAFAQGTNGYLWNAWDPTRVGGNGDNQFSFKNYMTGGGHSTDQQTQANNLYISNTYTGIDKTDRSFYDVRLGTGEQPILEMPEGLQWYYKTEWEGKQLYPEMEATNGTAVLTQVQATDEEGHKLWDACDEGTKVQDYEYVKQADGELVWDITATEDANGSKVKDYTYVEDPEGEYYHPMEKETSKDQDKCNAGVYWYFKTDGTYTEDPNGDWVLWSDGKYYSIAQLKGWGQSDDVIAACQHYSAGGSWVHLTTVSQDNYIFWNTDVYYVSDGYAAYNASSVVAGLNDTRYNKVYKDTYRDYNAETDAGEQRYNVVDNGLEDYDASNAAHASLDHYHKAYKEHVYRDFDSTKDATNEQRYCPTMIDVYNLVKGDTKDYRGWHQFVLTAYSSNTTKEQTTVTFYQSDDDWWTICVPYDLKYNDMKRFFGTSSKLPYVCKLLYVVRDYDLEHITLMFSQNLMEYKEDVDTDNNHVHGDIDNETKWTDGELDDNPVIIHAGVPYLIRPAASAYKTWDVVNEGDDADLYTRLKTAEAKSGSVLETEIYHGEYTVPAYVVGNGSEGTQESITIENKDGYSKTYTSGKITYRDSQVDAKISSAFKYTFVGSYFLSKMPQYSYFLGWDSKKNKAAFWYNAVANDDLSWNNQTGIICPNFNTSLNIDPATGLGDPARWTFSASDCNSDDLIGVTKKSSMMAFGGSLPSVTGIEEVATAEIKTVNNGVVYNINGQVVRTDGDLQGLSKGVYIVNGKKHVVK